jgi:hypothetical protein
MKKRAILFILLVGVGAACLGTWMIGQPEKFRTQFGDVPDSIILTVGFVLLLFMVFCAYATVAGVVLNVKKSRRWRR